MADRIRCFVIMPYSVGSDRAFKEAIEPALNTITEPRVIALRADLLEPQVPTLKAHVESAIASADFCIADLTGFNPNVLFELGYASALSKPLILIRESASSLVPIGLQDHAVLEFLQNDFPALRMRLAHAAHGLVTGELAARRLAEEVRKTSSEVYSVPCYRDRRLARLEEHFRQAQSQIDILTTSLSFVFEEPRVARGPQGTYFDAIEAALERDNSALKVRVLTLDPECDFAARRGAQLGFSVREFRDTLRRALNSAIERGRKWGIGRFEVRVYDEFPNQITFRIDDIVFYCIVAQPTQSRNQLTFQLDRRQPGVENSVFNHFQYVWGSASHV